MAHYKQTAQEQRTASVTMSVTMDLSRIMQLPGLHVMLMEPGRKTLASCVLVSVTFSTVPRYLTLKAVEACNDGNVLPALKSRETC